MCKKQGTGTLCEYENETKAYNRSLIKEYDTLKSTFYKNYLNIKIENLLDNADQLVNFGWKKEAIPVIHAKKSLLAKFFDTLFN